MSDWVNLPIQAFLPDPAMFGDDRPARFRRLLGLVRKLIDYGKELATSLQQRAAGTDLGFIARSFGTRDISLILARITQGLLRASAFEARVTALAARPYVPPRPASAPAHRAPRAPRPAAARSTDPADPRLALLPTPEQIAAQVRRRPLGVVIADICRDLGIVPNHPLWRELYLVIVRHGGSGANLLGDIFDRAMRLRALDASNASTAALPAPAPPPPEPTSTGPP